MNQPKRPVNARTIRRAVIVLLLSVASLVVAQRVLTGFEATVDGMPVARGDVAGDEVEVFALPEWTGDAAVTLSFDDGSSSYAFARTGDDGVAIATIEHGTEPLGSYLARFGLLVFEEQIASGCELMEPQDPAFALACPAYDPLRRPTDHPDVDGRPCSFCHDPNEIEDAYARARGVELPIDDATVAGPGIAMPSGHLDVEGRTCSTCHTIASGGPSAPVGDDSSRPPGHPDVAPGSCSTCHGDAGGGPGDAPSAPTGPMPPGHPDVAPGSCSTCHGDTGGGTPTSPPPSLPGDHPDIGTKACTACHDSPTGPTDDDEDEHEDEHEHEDEDDDHEDEDEHEDDD